MEQCVPVAAAGVPGSWQQQLWMKEPMTRVTSAFSWEKCLKALEAARMFSHSSAQETSKALQDNLSLHSAPSRCYQWGLKPCQLKRFEHQSTTNILLWSPASWGKYVRTKGGSWKTLGIIVAYWHLQQDFPVPFHSVTYKMGVSPCSLPPRFISLLEVILLASGWLHGSHVSFPEVYSLNSPQRRWLPLAKRFGSSQQPLLMSSQNGSSKNPDCHWFCPVVFFVLNDSLSTLSLMPSAGTSRTLFCRATSVKTLGFFLFISSGVTDDAALLQSERWFILRSVSGVWCKRMMLCFVLVERSCLL